MAEMIQNWQSLFRGRLHDLGSWSRTTTSVNLTYVPTGAGFTGIDQLMKFVNLFPATGHPLAPEQIQRFNNDYQVISCAFDAETKCITEELVISALHNNRIDYLLPAVEATNLVIVAKFAQDNLLSDVRIYWDQATLLRQLGVFHLAFNNLIRAMGKAAAFDNELDHVPIADGLRIAQRLVHPTIKNCNTLVSLDALELLRQINNQKDKVSTKLSPIGGLDNIQEMSHELPSLSPHHGYHSSSSSKSLPAFKSSVFAKPSEDITPTNTNITKPAALTSQLKLGDGSAEPVRPIGNHSHKQSIFGEQQQQHDIPTQHLHLAVDPMRNTSKIFQEDGSPFHPSVPLTDRSRFESKIFSDSPLSSPNVSKMNPQLESHISLTGCGDEALLPPKPSAQPNQTSPFARDDDDTPAIYSNATYKRNSQLASHFMGGDAYACSPMKTESSSLSSLVVDARGNRSSLKLTDQPSPDEQISPAINPRAASHNQSSLVLGDNPSLPPLSISTRVLQPPGGKSTLFLGGN